MQTIEWGERPYRTFDSASACRAAFRVCVETTDLYILADRDLTAEASTEARRARGRIEAHIAMHPAFATALRPLPPPGEPLEGCIASMYAAAQAAGVGPMAAVAGAIAGEVGRALRPHTTEVMVENGGDVYLDLRQEAVVALLAGASPFSGRLGVRIVPRDTPLAVCTSSGTVGPSLSYGSADAAVVMSADPALADAVATAMGNRVQKPDDVQAAVDWALALPGVRGAVAVLGDRLAARGMVEFVEVRCPSRATGDPPQASASCS